MCRPTSSMLFCHPAYVLKPHNPSEGQALNSQHPAQSHMQVLGLIFPMDWLGMSSGIQPCGPVGTLAHLRGTAVFVRCISTIIMPVHQCST